MLETNRPAPQPPPPVILRTCLGSGRTFLRAYHALVRTTTYGLLQRSTACTLSRRRYRLRKPLFAFFTLRHTRLLLCSCSPLCSIRACLCCHRLVHSPSLAASLLSSQLAPVISGGIETLDNETFTLQCFQTPTGELRCTRLATSVVCASSCVCSV